METNFKELGLKETFKTLGSSASGLSNREASKKLEKYGYNEIVERKKSPVVTFLKKLTGPIPIILWIVIAMSLILNQMANVYIVFALLLFNAVVGFLEEYKADKSIELLKDKLSVNSRVLREGAWQILPAKLLVQGDIIRIRSGDIIPADAKIIESQYLETDESVITGESLPAVKAVGDITYTGSTAKKGEATCVVVATGYGTVYGKTAKLVEMAKPKSRLQSDIMHIIKYLMIADIAVLVVMFAFGFLVINMPVSSLLPFILIMLVASVPVALPPTFTVAMAYGTEQLVKKHVLVSKLSAIEEFSRMDVLCLDKTGTLTMNQMAVKYVEGIGADVSRTVQHALEASRAEDHDPIDEAIISYSKTKGIQGGRQTSFTPFDPSTKMTEAIVGGAGGYHVAKGAVPVIKKLCKLGRAESKKLDKIVDRYSGEGLKVIAVAKGKNGRWTLEGVMAIYDMPRSEAKGFISTLKELSVKPMMLTGDNIKIAKETSGEIGIGGNITDAFSLRRLDERSMSYLVMKSDGFANIFPEDKYAIVKALQKKGNVVGMTGDGVNDAPALKQAEIGIAVANATDVAKSAAGIVLTKNGIDVIVEALTESRKIFERMLTYTMVKISKVFQIIVFIALIFIGYHFIPIIPFALVLLIFTNDFNNITLATDNVSYSKKPDVWSMKKLFSASIVMGMVMVAEAMLLLPLGFGLFNMTVAEFQTAVFVMLSLSDKVNIYNLRERSAFWKSRPSSMLLISSIVGSIITVAFAYYGFFVTSIGIYPILAIAFVALLFLPVNDMVKTRMFKHYGIS